MGSLADRPRLGPAVRPHHTSCAISRHSQVSLRSIRTSSRTLRLRMPCPCRVTVFSLRAAGLFPTTQLLKSSIPTRRFRAPDGGCALIATARATTSSLHRQPAVHQWLAVRLDIYPRPPGKPRPSQSRAFAAGAGRSSLARATAAVICAGSGRIWPHITARRKAMLSPSNTGVGPCTASATARAAFSFRARRFPIAGRGLPRRSPPLNCVAGLGNAFTSADMIRTYKIALGLTLYRYMGRR